MQLCFAAGALPILLMEHTVTGVLSWLSGKPVVVRTGRRRVRDEVGCLPRQGWLEIQTNRNKGTGICISFLEIHFLGYLVLCYLFPKVTAFTFLKCYESMLFVCC